MNFPITIKWASMVESTAKSQSELKSHASERIGFDFASAEELELEEGIAAWWSGTDPQSFDTLESALECALNAEGCEIIRSEYSEEVVLNDLKRALESKGYLVSLESSNLSQSKYCVAYRESDDKALKIRLSDHDLPAKYTIQSEEFTHDFRSTKQLAQFVGGLR